MRTLKSARALQAKTGIQEIGFLCGTHPPFHKPTMQALLERGEALTPIRHNCSGKHSGMLAFAKWKGWANANYLDYDHPVQRLILTAFSEMCGLPENKSFLA